MKRITNVFVCLAFIGAMAFGQDVQITGKVTSADDGSILPGVSVVVKGTTIGTTTNVDGEYSISAPSEATLIFSFIGMSTQELAVGNNTSIDVIMNSDVTGLEEVIVVGYGTSTREANTGSVAVIKNEDIKDVPETSFEKMLAGRVAGVQITATSGQPGANSQVRIRGASTINAGREPLYIVDGIPVSRGDQTYFTNTGNALGGINPGDIDNISVLKDAAAAAIYGSRAANGVILITTKTGKAGKTKVNFKTHFGFSTLANDNKFGLATPEQLIKYRQDAARNIGEDPNNPASSFYMPDSLLQRPMTNWLKEVTRTGKIKEYELSIAGGSEKTQHFTSAKYGKTEGVLHSVDFEKYQIRSNINHQINNKLKMGVKLNALHTMANDVPMQNLFFANPLWGALLINPYTPVRKEDGTFNLDVPANSNTNPIANSQYDNQWEKQNRLYGVFFLEWEPIKNLKLKTNNGAELTDSEGRRYWAPEARKSGDATLQTNRSQYSQITSSNTISYLKLVNDHTISLLGGAEIIDNRSNAYYIYSPEVDGDIPFPNTSPSDKDDADFAETRYTLASFFGILDYNFASKYYLRASLRTDGSSKFGTNYKFGTFYSIGGAWNIHNESFIQNLAAIDLLKFRINYGLSGNDNIGEFDQWGLYEPVQYNGVSGLGPDAPGNPDLTWENNAEYNIALDYGIFSRVSGSIEFYNRKTTDMLLKVPLSRTSGFIELRQNVGSIKNTGIEFLINANLVKSTINWNVGFNIAHNKSEILDLALEEGEFINPDNTRMIFKEGEQLLSYYLYDYAGVNPVNGEALWYDKNGKITNKYSEANRSIHGSPEPKVLGGFNTDISWKGLSFTANFEYKLGNKVLIEEFRYLNSDGQEFNSNQVNTISDYWKKPGDITRNPIPLANNTTTSNGFRNPRWMFNGSYLRIKNITLSYTFPASIASRVKLSNLRIYTSAKNLYTFHDVDFWDPERGEEGTGYGVYPMTKSIVFGLDLTF